MSATLATFERETDGPAAGVVTLTLHPGDRPVVVLDSARLRAIDAALDQIDAAEPPVGLVLASEGRVFIAGANLQEIMALADDELHEYLRFGSKVYGRFAAMACTTVAAINGAALGGGLEIAMHCDVLIGSEPPVVDGETKTYQVGLPEAGLKICPGWGGTVLLPARMDPARAVAMTATGETMPAEAAAAAGLLAEMVPAADLLDRSRVLAAAPKASARREPISIAEPARREAVGPALRAAIDALPGGASARAVARCVEAGLERGWAAALEAERESLVALRNSEEGRAAIEAFFAKSAGRR